MATARSALQTVAAMSESRGRNESALPPTTVQLCAWSETLILSTRPSCAHFAPRLANCATGYATCAGRSHKFAARYPPRSRARSSASWRTNYPRSSTTSSPAGRHRAMGKRIVDRLREQDQRNGRFGSPLSHQYSGDHTLGDLPGARLDEVDAAELAKDSAELHLEYLALLGQDGYLVRGWSHLIASYPRCGKTELVTACCRDWLTAGEHILYLTEEPRAIWQHRLARAGAEVWTGMRLVFGLGANPLDLWARA